MLAISQSALSHAIASLEDDLGVSLFDREGRRIFLNAAGSLLLERGERLLREKQELEEQIRSQSGEMHGTIRLAAPIAINSYFLGPVWAKVATSHPLLRAEISSLRSIEIVPKAISGEIDYGVCFGPQAHPLLAGTLLANRKLLVVVHRRISNKFKNPASEVAKGLSLMPASLPRGLLGFGQGETHPFFERHKIRPNVALLYDNYDVALSFVEATSSWALLPDWIAEHYSENFRTIASDVLFESLEISGVRAKNRLVSPIKKIVETELISSLQISLKRSKK